LAALAVSLAAVNAVFLLWPDFDVAPDLARDVAPSEQIVLEVIEPTTQPPPPATLPPTPPPPPVSDLPPVEVPDEVIEEDIVRDLTIPTPPAPTPRPSANAARVPAPAPAPPAPAGPPTPAPSAPPPAADRIVERPDRSPSLSGQALPVYPRNASVSDFRGRARVRVLVSSGGRVTEAEILERAEFRGGREVAVASFPAEFDAAILDAARRHVFRPARDDGERVRAYAYISVSLDPPQ
jgi:outer membrane biosynthesis protein TonB